MFCHLHVHSHYSLLDGLPKIDELVNKAVEFKMPALALTDHGAMYGSIEFYKTCRGAGIKPIIGLEAYITPFKTLATDAKERTSFHLTLLAANLTGYKNLLKLTTYSWLEGFYYRPRINYEILKKHSAGLIILSGCPSGEISKLLLQNKLDQAAELATFFQQIVDPDHFYLEIQDASALPDNLKLRSLLPQLAAQVNAPLAATNDVHYLNLSDKAAQDALVCIQINKKINDTDRPTLRDYDLHFASSAEMAEKFADLPAAVSATQTIADMCQVELELGKWVFPAVDIPDKTSAEVFLRTQATQGLKNKLEKIPDNYLERLNYELEIIDQKGYAPYFLVLADIVRFAESQNIITTTRGSAAGSLVSFAMGITTADPMSFNLPFERFLNPYRPSPPDIDLDIEDARRLEIIEYVRQKYGADKVAHIITFGTLQARAAARDVGRVLGLPYSFCDKVAKMIPFGSQGFKMNLERALEENPNLKQAYLEHDDVRQMIDLAKQIEGCVRHASLHAAGIVIAPTELSDYAPLQRDSKQGEVTTQYDMHAIEDAGLLKMDLLGITNLSILGLARKIIERTSQVNLDFAHLPLDDLPTYELLAAGKTMGMFQLSGSGMTRYLKELKPTNIFDIMAMISLYRPGPIDSIPEFIRRKHHPELITYPHPRLKEILRLSYGVLTYQDDVLLTAIELAGYDWQEADKLRKAIGKKIPAEMAAQKNKFISGCVDKSGLTPTAAHDLWKLIEPFAAYGFNKAHGCSYALVAYATAFVKANYPVEFMAALMTCESGDMEKVAAGMAECANLNIKVRPSDVNESLGGFTVVGEKNAIQNICFGLKAIKHLGENIIDEIIATRKTDGQFTGLEDFLQRVPGNNKKSLEALVRSGALDRFGDRALLDYNIPEILEFARLNRDDAQADRLSLFNTNDMIRKLVLRPLPAGYEYPLLVYEKEYLGLYLSAHPLDKFRPYLAALKISSIREITAQKESTETPVKLLGIVRTAKAIKTKTGDPMLFVTLEDWETSTEVLVFPRLLKKTAAIWQVDNIVLINGSRTTRDDELKIIADRARLVDWNKLNQIITAENAPAKIASTTAPAIASQPGYFINLPAKISKLKLTALKSAIKDFAGNTPLYLRIEGDRVKIVKTKSLIKVTPEFEEQVQKILEE